MTKPLVRSIPHGVYRISDEGFSMGYAVEKAALEGTSIGMHAAGVDVRRIDYFLMLSPSGVRPSPSV